MGFYNPPPRLNSIDVIKFIKSIGAVAVLAHPFLDLDEKGLNEFLTEAKEAGLDAMETNYSKFDKETTEKAIQIAKNHGILTSGGSDFHGERKPEISLGTGYGDLVVPFEYYLALENLSKNSI
jgi:predicted metal-dependent phosphoesterase TrpH